MPTYLCFEQHPRDAKRKTDSWAVVGAASGIFLGTIKWKASWRRYAFFPASDTVFDAACLGEVVAFLTKQMETRGG